MSFRAASITAALGLAAALLAQPIVLAADFQVSTYTNSNQSYPAVARAANGAFVVVWESFGQDGSDYGVFGQRFDSAGAKLGMEFLVNQLTAYAQGSPAVATDDQGDFVVTWQSLEGGYGTSSNIFARRFDSTGTGQAADGLLFLRDSFGFGGSTLIGGAVDADSTRCTAGAIADHIDGLGVQLDIDGNSSLQPLTDGLLALRYIFGFRGSTLISGAVGQMCSRCTAEQIEPYLGSLVAIPTDPL